MSSDFRLPNRKWKNMSTTFRKVYSHYINRNLSPEMFDEFRREFNSISDEKLWEIMIDEEAESSQEIRMSFEAKEEIQKDLLKIIRKQCLRRYMKYAACVAVVLSVSLSIYTWLGNPNNQRVAVAVKAGSKAEITLPDGTHVHLNAATDIKYDVSKRNERLVWLSGEAFFDVAHDRDRPFKVIVDDLQIKVLGTSFNVKAYKNGYIETSLFSGSVVISGRYLAQDYRLSPGEKSTYSIHDKTLLTTPSDVHVESGWREDYLIFYAQPLSNVIEQIERWYGVEIILQRSYIADDLLSGSFRNESIQNVIESLSRQYKFQYKIEKDIITIY